MYISYEKLWKLLIDKHITKTDLISLCGISSRTLTKLSKNQNVNSDTLLRICEALDCDLTDIMELRHDDANRSVYEVFCAEKKLVSSDELCKTYSFDYQGKKVIVRKTVKKATHSTEIRCMVNTVQWVQNTVVMNTPFPKVTAEIPFTDLLDEDILGILVISGKPNLFRNLDEGVCVSGNGTPKGKRFVYVMSEARFKLFEPKIEE